MPISDIMTTTLVTVGPEQTVGELEPLFRQHGIHHLLVVDEGKLLGVISDRDVLRNLSPFVNTTAEDDKDAFLLGRKAHQIMRKQLVTIEPSAGIREACQVILEGKVSLLPVTENNTLVGVVSWKDILGFFLD